MPKTTVGAVTAEHARLAEATGRAEDDLFSANPWYEWGPYLSERAWGTVREDYSESGDAWDSFPHDHARSRAYRWNEDGMAGISDIRHDLCLALALWNGQRPDPQGADVRAHRAAGQPRRGRQGVLVVPRRAAEPRAAEVALPLPAGRRSRTTRSSTTAAGSNDPELELLDTGAFDDDRFWSVDVTYAKASPTEVLMRIELENHGPDEATIDVLPTLWFRNTWSWGDEATRPKLDGRRLGGRGRGPRVSPATGSRRPPAPTARSRRRCSARTRRTRRGSSARRRRRRTRRTGSTTTSSRAPTPSTRTASARRRRSATA